MDEDRIIQQILAFRITQQIQAFDDSTATLRSAFECYLLTEESEGPIHPRKIAALRDAFYAGACSALKTELDWWPDLKAYAKNEYGISEEEEED